MKAQIKGIKNKPLPFISAFSLLKWGIKSSGVNKLETLKLLMQNASSKTGDICSKQVENDLAHMLGPWSRSLRLSAWES